MKEGVQVESVSAAGSPRLIFFLDQLLYNTNSVPSSCALNAVSNASTYALSVAGLLFIDLIIIRLSGFIGLWSR